MRIAWLALVFGISLEAQTVAAMEQCFEEYALCMGYCDKLKGLCAVRCDDRRLLCERKPAKKQHPKSLPLVILT